MSDRGARADFAGVSLWHRLRIYDHYLFRSAQENQKTKARKVLEFVGRNSAAYSANVLRHDVAREAKD
jgi:hypothetical protein